MGIDARTFADAISPTADMAPQFHAVAMPNGDARYGLAGPLVMLSETYSTRAYMRGAKSSRRYLSREAAEALMSELQRALSTFNRAARMAAGDAE